MNGNRWSPVDEVFNFQRQMDRVFDQFWNELPNRTTRATGAFQVTAEDDGWRIDVPMPGTDPKHVNVEVAGNTLCIRAQHPDQGRNAQGGNSSYEQTLLVPQFLDLERLRATHRHGMLQLTLPLKESVKPRRIEIENVAEDQKQLTAS
jgi:HSP20 family protein